jgi:non-ribosomal peptide synthetase component E (peptide arylation enzyme)
MQLIGEMLDNTAKAYPDYVAMIFEGASWSYQKLIGQVKKMIQAYIF